jgi:cell division protein FtsB
MRRDFPVEYELTVLRATVDALTAENEQLKAGQPYDPTAARPYLNEEGRHG